MVQSDEAKCGSFANAQDDIYKSAPSPVILEERSDEESQTEPLPLLLVARRPTRQGLVPARRRKMRAVFISVCPIAAMRWVPRSMRKELWRIYLVVED